MMSQATFNRCYEEDGVLVERARAGDREAFDRLAERYRAALLGMAFVRCGSREDAEDLVQEVLAQSWRQIGTLRQPHLFAAWLRTLMLNACRGWYRRSVTWPRSLEEEDTLLDLADPGPTPLEVILERERQQSLRKALLAIPESNRTALLMRIWGDYSYQEIAAFLEVPVTTVEGRIHRARAQLRRLMGSEIGGLAGKPSRKWKEDEP